MEGLGTVFADEFQIGFPHIGADEGDFGNDVLAHSGEEVAAPAETRTPNLQRAIKSLTKSADGRVATVATRQRQKKKWQTKTQEPT
jgi:hypothetical protein